MADYTFHSLTEVLKNDDTIQTILDVDALATPAKTALAGYVASLELPTSQTQHLTWENIGVATIIESLAITYYLPSLGVQTPAPALKRTSTLRDKVIEMQALESKFPKCQMLMFTRVSAASDWVWVNTEVIQNSGNRVNTLQLLPYINQKNVFISGRGTQIGIQFIADPASNSTLPQEGDRLTVQGSIGLDINPIGADTKKNDEVGQFESRLAALETLLQPFGAATATAAGTTGLVPGAAVGQTEHLLRGDRQWQNPAAFVRMIGEQFIEGLKTFGEVITGNKAIRSVGVGDLSRLSTQSQAAIWCSGGGGYLTLVSAAAAVNAKIIDFELNPQGVFSIRRINDAYNAILSTLLQVDATNNLRLPNFTNLGGNISIKTFLISGTTPSTQGSTVSIPLGIDSGKVVDFSPLVHFDINGRTPPSSGQVPSEYECYLDENVLVLKLHPTNSAWITSKPFSCLITYTN